MGILIERTTETLREKDDEREEEEEEEEGEGEKSDNITHARDEMWTICVKIMTNER